MRVGLPRLLPVRTCLSSATQQTCPTACSVVVNPVSLTGCRKYGSNLWVSQVSMPNSGNIPDCAQNQYLKQGAACLTFLYTPNNDTSVNDIVAAMRSNNIPVIPDSRTLGFASMTEADAYLYANPQTTLGAVHFNVTDAQHVSFSLQSNSSTDWFNGHYQHPNTYLQLPLQMAAERETARHLANGGDYARPGNMSDADSNLAWDVTYTTFAHPASQSASVVGNIAPTFFFASAMFNFVLLLHNLVSEKESGVRQVMSTMGLLTSPFWLTWTLFEGVQALVSSLLILAASYAFHFDIMWQNNFWLSFFLLLLINLALVAFCFFVSTFLRHSSAAVPAGFGLFIVAWVMLLIVAFGFPYSTKYSKGLVALFSLFPWTILGKGIGDLASATTGDGAVGISWSQRYSYCQSQDPSPSQQQSLGYYTTNCIAPLPHLFLIALAQCFGYMTLAVYLDKALPDRMGVRLPPWYPLLPSYWSPPKVSLLVTFPLFRNQLQRQLCFMPTKQLTSLLGPCDEHLIGRLRRTSTQRAAAALQLAAQEEEDSTIDADVAVETAAMQIDCQRWITTQAKIQGVSVDGHEKHSQGCTHQPQPVQGIVQQPRHSQGCFLQPGQVSQHDIDSHVTGLGADFHEAAGNGPGDAGHLKAHDAPSFGAQLCCKYTVEQATDGVSADAPKMLEDMLKPAEITQAAERQCAIEMFGLRRTFTKHPAFWRRLLKRQRSAQAVAVKGNWLGIQEGMDPISRRHLWDLIASIKERCAIVLTTHSMEEAGILGDRIGIMARGQLCCLGSGLHLKQKFGSGYRLSVHVQQDADSSDHLQEDRLQQVAAFVQQHSGAVLVDKLETHLHFKVPTEAEATLTRFFAKIKEDRESLHIGDVQLRLTPLEEVFMAVAREAEMRHAQHTQETTDLTLHNGTVLQVPMGASDAVAPDGQVYILKWVQDDNGRLHLQDHKLDTMTEYNGGAPAQEVTSLEPT